MCETRNWQQISVIETSGGCRLKLLRGSPRGASSHCWHDSHLLGRAERSTPEARRGAPWARGVDGESADRAIMAMPMNAPRGSWYRASIFNSLLPGVRTRCEQPMLLRTRQAIDNPAPNAAADGCRWFR